MSSPEEYLHRLSRYTQIDLDPEKFFRLYSSLLKEGGKILPSRYGKIGSFKITTSEGERILREDAIVEKVEGVEMTISEYAKFRLLQEIQKGKRWRWKKEQRELLEEHARIPQYALPIRMENALYVDLRSAYYGIYSRFLFCDYLPNRYLKLPHILPDFRDLESMKAVRNSVFGLMRATKGIQYTYHGAKLVSIRNVLYHPSLCLLTYDILNAIALEMVEKAGAVYVNTDGYIIPYEKYPIALEIALRWGFDLKIEAQGEAHVVAVGCYRVGEKISEPYRQNRIKKEHYFRALNTLSDPEWLMKRIQGFLQISEED